MQTLKIEVDLDLGNPTQMEAARLFIAALSETEPSKVIANGADQEPSPPIEKKVPVKRKRRSKTQIAEDKAREEAKEVEEISDTSQQAGDEEPKVSEKVDSSDLSISDVRTKLSEKVKGHRDAIKDKLVELGAKNISTLEIKDYEVFVEFLDSL